MTFIPISVAGLTKMSSAYWNPISRQARTGRGAETRTHSIVSTNRMLRTGGRCPQIHTGQICSRS